MRLIMFASMFALAVFTTGVDAASPPSNSALPPPITTRQTLFSIPFQIERVEQAEQNPVEVQLYVSTDRGAHWQIYHRVPPQQNHFLFRAVTDGEYWFLIRTLDRSGQLRPQRADGPGLRVVVDTTLPEFELQARRGEAGEIVVRWQVVEPYLDVNSLKIQYRAGPNLPWESVAIDRQSISPAGPKQTGEVIWWPNSRSDLVEIRAEVADTAGNSAVSHAKVKLDRLVSSDPDPAANRKQDNPTNMAGPVPPSASPWRPSADATPPPSTWQTDPPIAADPTPALGHRYGAPPRHAVDTTATPTASDNPPKMVNSRLFELEYQMDPLALSGGERVELWGTRDGGLSWSNFGADRDKQTPMLVTVHEEGLYGFRVVVQDPRLDDQKPQRGDQPDVWIAVDLTKPAGRIISARRGTGDQAGQMIIDWEAEDQMLATRPISLLISGAAGGPWTTIASGVENTGRYSWPINSRLPRQVHVRLEVRDNAGNVGVFETAETGASDPLRPAVRIQDVRPLVESAQGVGSGGW